MLQEASTIQRLLGNPDTADMGFEMSKHYISHKDVQDVLYTYVMLCITPGKLEKRMINYLIVMEIIDHDGKRITDS